MSSDTLRFLVNEPNRAAPIDLRIDLVPLRSWFDAQVGVARLLAIQSAT